MANAKFEVNLDDGHVAQCHRNDKIEYRNGIISAGLVENLGTDTVYLCLASGDDELFVFLRPDEALAVIHQLAAALFTDAMLERDVDARLAGAQAYIALGDDGT